MILRYWVQTRALRVVWALEEIGTPYEIRIVDIPAGRTLEPEFLALNPMGKLPVLVDGDTVVAESAAILAYLAERFPEAGLAPPPGDPTRGRYLQWLFFAVGVFEPAAFEFLSGTETDTKRRPWGDWSRAIAAIESALSVGPWLVGERFTMADPQLGFAVDHLDRIGAFSFSPVIRAYLERLRVRHAYGRALELERRELRAIGIEPTI